MKELHDLTEEEIGKLLKILLTYPEWYVDSLTRENKLEEVVVYDVKILSKGYRAGLFPRIAFLFSYTDQHGEMNVNYIGYIDDNGDYSMAYSGYYNNDFCITTFNQFEYYNTFCSILGREGISILGYDITSFDDNDLSKIISNSFGNNTVCKIRDVEDDRIFFDIEGNNFTNSGIITNNYSIKWWSICGNCVEYNIRFLGLLFHELKEIITQKIIKSKTEAEQKEIAYQIAKKKILNNVLGYELVHKFGIVISGDIIKIRFIKDIPISADSISNILREFRKENISITPSIDCDDSEEYNKIYLTVKIVDRG